MITSALALVFGLQATAEVPIAIINENPETWTIEYPRLIQPFVADYRGCLNFTIRYVTGVPDFEAQHRSDVPRCAEVRAKAVADSKKAMAEAKTKLDGEEIEELFSAIGTIHIQRGRDLDQQFAMRVEAAERAAEAGPPRRPPPLVIELPDPSVVKSREESLKKKP